MSKHHVTQVVRLAVIAAIMALSVADQSFAQEPALPQMNLEHWILPWAEGTVDDAVGQAGSGATIPMSPYDFVASKDGNPYKGVLVGGDPFGFLSGSPPSPVTIHAVVIPLIIKIASTTVTTFNPTSPNSCDGFESAQFRFRHSPLVVASALTFNGVTVGSNQYINGFMRAQFWKLIGGASSYSNPISWSFASAVTLPPFVSPSTGIVSGTGCGKLGIVSGKFFNFSLLTNVIPILQAQGVISPTQFAVFLLKNVVLSPSTPPKCCSVFVYHGATGSPAQTFAVIDYDTTGRLPHDIGSATHEIGEWMNDPLGNNPTPAWGGVGQVTKSCQGNFEVGDPLTGTGMPTITMSGYNYHAQELAFFSWFYNSDSLPSYGSGGKFSGNGTFKGPSKVCPPGGTF